MRGHLNTDAQAGLETRNFAHENDALTDRQQLHVKTSIGSIQICANLEAGCEAAIHAMHSILKEEETEGVFLIDAANAFNSTDRYFCIAYRFYVHQYSHM